MMVRPGTGDSATRRWRDRFDQGSAPPLAVGRALRVLRLATAISWLLPLVLLALVAWQTWQLEMEELDARLTSTLAILSEQVQKVFENQALALAWIDDRTRRLTWSQIAASSDLFDLMKDLADRSPYIDTIFLADETGIVRATSSRFPLDRPISVADRDYFLASKQEATGIHIGDPARGRLNGNLAFRVAQRRSNGEGRFEGIVAVGLTPSFIAKLFSAADSAAGDVMCLMRTDGEVLVSSGSATPDVSGSVQACTEALRKGARIGNVLLKLEGSARIAGSRPVPGYPLAVVFAVERKSVRAEWLQSLYLYAAEALASALVLFGLSFGALRIAQGERRAIAAWRDEVEQRQRMEVELRQASKIEALGRMAGGIAHHFNNLLPAMAGLLKLTLTEVPPGSATARRLERMTDSVAQGQRLVRNILLFSRRQVTAHERVVAADAVEHTIALLESSLPTNVRVVARLDCRAEVLADAAQLQEAIMNLVSNAVQAIGAKEGTVEVETSSETLGVEAAAPLGVEPGPFVHIACRDNGVGMTAEVTERAFDPFFTTKPGAEGTGLGLAIVHGVVTGLGGGIRVDSTPGVGSAFHLYLPMAAAARARAIAA